MTGHTLSYSHTNSSLTLTHPLILILSQLNTSSLIPVQRSLAGQSSGYPQFDNRKGTYSLSPHHTLPTHPVNMNTLLITLYHHITPTYLPVTCCCSSRRGLNTRLVQRGVNRGTRAMSIPRPTASFLAIRPSTSLPTYKLSRCRPSLHPSPLGPSLRSCTTLSALV